jgi:hypothetical protein
MHPMIYRAPFALALLPAITGCSLLAAAGNPGAFWAVNDPATLPIVVRRADDALITTAEVNRLLTATPAGKDTPWVSAVSPDPKLAAAEIKALQNDPDYSVTKARVVAAEVWIRTLPDVGATEGEHPSLLAAIDQGLADSYLAIGLKQGEIASLKAQIETEKQAASADGVTPGDKKTHEDQVTALQKQADDADTALGPLRKTFLGQVKDASAKVSAEDKARYAPAVASLLQALDDADMANSAAALKYPIVIKGLPDALKKLVPKIAMDVVEEQTGVRPNLANLKVGISMSGGTPSVTLDGLGDVGNLSPADIIKVTATRSIAWFTHTLTLLATIATTKDHINFERETLSQMQAAFASAAPGLVVVKIPAFDSPDVTSAAPAKSVSLVALKRAKLHGGGFTTNVDTSVAENVKAPGVPGVPKGAGMPGMPGVAGMPKGAGMPGAPGMPKGAQIPGMPGVPGMPKGAQVPGMPAVPGMPKGAQVLGAAKGVQIPGASAQIPGAPAGAEGTKAPKAPEKKK